MAEKFVTWCASSELSCGKCFPVPVILCVKENLLAPYQCVEPGEQPPEGYGYALTTLEVELRAVYQFLNSKGKCTWKYTFAYESDNLVDPEGELTTSDILGVICDGCLTQWVRDQVGQEITAELINPGTLRLTSQHGCIYDITVGGFSECSEILDCIHVDPTTIDGDGSEAYPFSAIGAEPSCENIRSCIFVDPTTIDGDGSEEYPFTVIGLDCETIRGCTSFDPATIDGDGTVEYPYSALYQAPECEDVLDCIHTDGTTILGAGTEGDPYRALTGVVNPLDVTSLFDTFTVVPSEYPNGHFVSSIISGGGSSILPIDTTSGIIGLVELTADTAASISTSPGCVVFGSGTFNYYCNIAIPTLVGGGNDFRVACGFLDNPGSCNGTDGAYVLYDAVGVDTSAQPYWQTVTADNGVYTYNQGHTPVNVNTGRVNIWIQVSLLPTQARFYVSTGMGYTLIGTHTTNVPLTRTTGLSIALVQDAGDPAVINADYIWLNYTPLVPT